MTQPESYQVRLHEEPDLLRDLIQLTAGHTGFPARLIEKDYYCTVLLERLTRVTGGRLVFKGGTCLAKVHAAFYRLSEDLDFVIPMPLDAARSQRSKQAVAVRKAIEVLADGLSEVRVVRPVTGANNSTQYVAVIGYRSLLTGDEETITIEVGLREPLHLPVVEHAAKTLLLDPVTHESMVAPVQVPCIAKLEAFAEKFRAALSRRQAAIRDFFDLDYAILKLGLQATDAELVRLVKRKLAVPGNAPADISPARLEALQRQLDPQLKPVLRESEFQAFDLARAFRIATDMAARLAE
jgi:predicted nucleotidyltransferase component of viral defense system